MQSTATAALEGDPILDAITALVRERVNVAPSAVSPRATFADLGLDSLDAVDVMMAIEKKFSITFTGDDYKQVDRLADVIALVRAKLG